MRSFFLGVASLALLIASATAACNGDTSTSSTPSDGGNGTSSSGGSSGDVDGSQPTDASVGDAGLFPTDTTKIVFTSKGGGPLPPPPDGSVCQETDITYTLLLPSRELSWKVCEGFNGAPYTYRTGQKTLTAEQYATIEAPLKALTRTTTVQCGADKPSEQIVFTRPSGDVTYYDDFYFCDASDPKIYVHGLEDVFSAMTMLAQ